MEKWGTWKNERRESEKIRNGSDWMKVKSQDFQHGCPWDDEAEGGSERGVIGKGHGPSKCEFDEER